MNYEIRISKRALKFISQQPLNRRKRIFKAIYCLPEGDTKQLKGTVFHRLRVGDYRIIYFNDNNVMVIEVVNAGNRGDIYKSI